MVAAYSPHGYWLYPLLAFGIFMEVYKVKKLIMLLLFLAFATATIMADGPEPIPLCWPWPACSK